MPPGVVGQQQLMRSPFLAGYSQPVELRGPDGVEISPLIDGAFGAPQRGPVLVGMLVGHVYQLKLTGLPSRPGDELYPTIEVLNRLYPPEGLQLRYPVPVEFSREEIDLALDGRFVTRVIYLEDSDNPLPQADDPQQQRVIEVGPKDDPLFVADRYGRPMAIVRMGSRVPAENELGGIPGFGSPPLELFEYPVSEPAQIPQVDPLDRAIERENQAIPRRTAAPYQHRLQPTFANPYQR